LEVTAYLLIHTNQGKEYISPVHSLKELVITNQNVRSVITALLEQIPKLFSMGGQAEPVLLPALNAAQAALAQTGGKIVCSLAALPTWGPGRLYMREDSKLHGLETEKKLFQTENPMWKKAASKMVEGGIGVDSFVAAPGGAYMDIATIGEEIFKMSGSRRHTC
jgi:protein transport protein SEC24